MSLDVLHVLNLEDNFLFIVDNNRQQTSLCNIATVNISEEDGRPLF